MADESDFLIEKIKIDESEEIAEFINDHFLPYETLERGLHASKEDLKDFHSKGAVKWLSPGLSVRAIHKDSKAVAGICLSVLVTRTTTGPFEEGEEEKEKTQNEKEKKLKEILANLDKEVDIFEDPEIQKILEIVILTVDKKFSGKGVSYLLMSEAEKMAIENGCQLLYSQATGLGSQHILTKCNYKPLKKIELSQLEVNGRKVIDTSAVGGATHVVIYSKDIRDKAS